MIDFDDGTRNLKYMGMEIPEHTKDTVRNYLLRGWAPGGFVESMIAKDYERALYCADTANRQMFWAIAMWINECMPRHAVGSYDAIEKWRDDFNGHRTEYVKAVEQDFIWKNLSEKQHA
jgi:hypothetical protein